MLKSIARHWRNLKEWAAQPRRVVQLASDTLPSKMPKRDLVLLTEGDEVWSAALNCPCGCGERIELMLINEARPRWSLRIDRQGRPTLHPSVWRRDGCRSHFFVRAGKVTWV